MSNISIDVQHTDPGKVVVMLKVEGSEKYRFLNDKAQWVSVKEEEDIPDNCHLSLGDKLELVYTDPIHTPEQPDEKITPPPVEELHQTKKVSQEFKEWLQSQEKINPHHFKMPITGLTWSVMKKGVMPGLIYFTKHKNSDLVDTVWASKKDYEKAYALAFGFKAIKGLNTFTTTTSVQKKSKPYSTLKKPPASLSMKVETTIDPKTGNKILKPIPPTYTAMTEEDFIDSL